MDTDAKNRSVLITDTDWRAINMGAGVMQVETGRRITASDLLRAGALLLAREAGGGDDAPSHDIAQRLLDSTRIGARNAAVIAATVRDVLLGALEEEVDDGQP